MMETEHELHLCTCGSTCEGDGCSPTFRDRCRFEQALADPVDAQVQAGAAVLEGVDGVVDAVGAARLVLAAGAAVVLERPPCNRCGRPEGTGTLLDFRPMPPTLAEQARVMADAGIPPDLSGMERIPLEQWREFAPRYRCPVCAEAEPVPQFMPVSPRVDG